MTTDSKLSPLISGTRRLLLEHLLGTDDTAVSLAKKVSIHISAIRNHLAVLELNGLVSSRLERATRGRPKRLYSLTALARSLFPKRVDRILDAILQATENQCDPDTVIKIIQRAARNLWNDILSTPPSGSIVTRLEHLVTALDNFGFYARLIKRRRVYEIEIHNCIFQSLLQGKTQRLLQKICQELRGLLEGVVREAKVEWIQPESPGDYVHRVIVKKGRSG